MSFVDAGGREAIVARDYKAGDELLLAVEHAIDDSGIFRLVLTPKNDPISHEDHFPRRGEPRLHAAGTHRPRSCTTIASACLAGTPSVN